MPYNHAPASSLLGTPVPHFSRSASVLGAGSTERHCLFCGQALSGTHLPAPQQCLLIAATLILQCSAVQCSQKGCAECTCRLLCNHDGALLGALPILIPPCLHCCPRVACGPTQRRLCAWLAAAMRRRLRFRLAAEVCICAGHKRRGGCRRLLGLMPAGVLWC